MNQQESYVVVRKGKEEAKFYGDTFSQLLAGGNLNLDLFKKEKKLSHILLLLLLVIFLVVLSVIPSNYQVVKFLTGSVVSTFLAGYLYIIYEKKFLFLGIVVVGIIISLVSSQLMGIPKLIEIIERLLKI